MLIWELAQDAGLEWSRHEREQHLLALCCYVQAQLWARHGAAYVTTTQWDVPEAYDAESRALIAAYLAGQGNKRCGTFS